MNKPFIPIYWSTEHSLWWGLCFWSDTSILFHCLAQVFALCFWKIKKYVDQCESHSSLLQESCSMNQNMFSVVISNLLKHIGNGNSWVRPGAPAWVYCWAMAAVFVEFFNTLLTELIIYSQRVRSWLSSLQSPKTDLNKPEFCI